MENKEKIAKILAHQNNANYHDMTCGNDSQHLPLTPKEVDGQVILMCLECDYIQEHIPPFVLNE